MKVCFYILYVYQHYINIADLYFLLQIVPSNHYVYSAHHEGRTYIVCLKNKICICKRFQMDEIPCLHAWTVINKKHFDVGPYCSDMYKPSNLLDTYNIPITPLPNQNEWNVPEYIKDDRVRPPKHKKLPRRPSKKYRDKAYSELSGKKSKNSRGTCGFKEHNRRSCRNGPHIV
ncbi:hypothetical protein MTR67_040648 [Solanum verrucosum]|uniref:SWIM-type domain-containing protein n=1 Tax=Solanum verrucosum TaxID=315347 RepID=A0AAF0UKR7_SOLVR|nr:hypothetical protein MTR67_040648 [Solanum verrucosum]